MADEFKVWLFRERFWQEGQRGRQIGGSYAEPAAAADAAESVLEHFGVKGQSYCELRFNGDQKPHTLVCLMEDGTFGIWNTESVQWPIFYPPEGPTGVMLPEFPFMPHNDGSKWDDREDDGEGDEEEDGDEGKHKKDDDSQVMKLDGADDDEDDADEDEIEDDESDDEEDGEDDTEMPRLKIFAKLRGPRGWRKRSETEELFERNQFVMKLGVLDEDAPTATRQEREVFAEVRFIESDEDRTQGTLKLKLNTFDDPDTVEFIRRGQWLELDIPYRQPE